MDSWIVVQQFTGRSEVARAGQRGAFAALKAALALSLSSKRDSLSVLITLSREGVGLIYVTSS